MERHVLGPGGEADLETAIAYFSAYEGGQGSPLAFLRSTVSDEELLEVVCKQVPAIFMENLVNYLDVSGIVDAFNKTPGITAGALANSMKKYNDALDKAAIHALVVVGRRFGLAEHHLYGSSRLGIKYYWSGQYSWAANSTVGWSNPDSSIISSRFPWFSRAMSDFMQPQVQEPVWNFMDYSSWNTARVLGQKRYELTDHLGDVQATVLDRKTPVVKDDTLVVAAHADISHAVDMYPFGSYMPGRYTADTTTQCITVAVSQLESHWEDFPLLPVEYTPQYNLTTLAQWSLYPGEDNNGIMNWLGNGTGMEYVTGVQMLSDRGMWVHFETVPETKYQIEMEVDINNAGELLARVYALDGIDDLVLLRDTRISSSATLVFKFTAPAGNSYFYIGLPIGEGTGPIIPAKSFKVKLLTIHKLVYSPVTKYVTICNGKDDYRFGYNGQEKDNQIKGLGNSLDYAFRMYDSRLGRFFCTDPIAKNFPWNSPYVFAENRVIDGLELEGLEVIFLNPQTNTAIYSAALKQTDKNAIHLFAHGTQRNIQLSNGKWTNSASKINADLNKTSAEWRNRSHSGKTVLVMHSCRTGRQIVDASGKKIQAPIAQTMSESSEFRDVYIVAPDERVAFEPDGSAEIGPRLLKNGDINGEHLPGAQDVDRKSPGAWVIYRNGEVIGVLKGQPIVSGTNILTIQVDKEKTEAYKKGEATEDQKEKGSVETEKKDDQEKEKEKESPQQNKK